MSSTTATWLVTGSSRGLGIEMVIQLLYSPSNVVIATARNPSRATSLIALRAQNKTRLHILQLDVTDQASIRQCASAAEAIFGEHGLDYLVNNAGIMMVMNDQPLSFDVQDFFNVIRTNVLGPALILRAFLPLLERGKRKVVVNVTSRLGCITQAAELYGAHMAMYATSKAALNMFTVKTACQRPDMIVFALSPGHNSTDSGGEDAPHDPEDTVAALLPFISLVTSKHSGKYWDYWGREIEVYPW